MDSLEPSILVWDRLRENWSHWRKLALSTEKTNEPEAEAAVNRLYAVLGYPSPRIEWLDGIYQDSLPPRGQPIMWLRDTILHPAFSEIFTRSRLAVETVGYNARRGRFRLSENKAFLFPDRYYLRRLRAPGLRNLICRFDVDALALEQTSRQTLDLGVRFAPYVAALLEATFGGFLFSESCALIRNPRHIDLDENQLLRASYPTAAFVFSDKRRVFARNGFLFGNVNGVGVDPMNNPSRRLTIAWIDFYGWENVLREANKVGTHFWNFGAQILDQSPSGILYRLRCHPHEFLVVEVKNATPEPDGKRRRFVIPVHPRCRPLPDPRDPNGKLGAPQELTALNAVASTFGMTGQEYAEMLGQQS